MSYENTAGLNVNNHYGVRSTGGAVGGETRDGSEVTLRIDLTGKSINEGIAGFVPPYFIPKGAKMVSFDLRIDEAFVVTGTNPTVRLGGAAAATTNGVVLTEAQLEAVGTKAVTAQGAGTWATSSATGTTVAEKVVYAALGGTDTPAVDPTVGKGTLIIKYLDVAKA